jgi:hypothetical protein
MRFLLNLLDEFDAALDWQEDDDLLADHQPPGLAPRVVSKLDAGPMTLLHGRRLVIQT